MRWLYAFVALFLASAAFAEDRSPFYANVDIGIGAHPALALPWGGLPLSPELKVGVGTWKEQRVGTFLDLGLFSRVKHQESSIGDQIFGPTERFRMMPIRAGFKKNLRPRPDWVQVDLVLGVSFAAGYREIAQPDVVLARDLVVSPGAVAGIEWMIVKYKRVGTTFRAQYVLQPTLLSKHGYLTGGIVDLGGPEIMIGWVVFP